MSMCVVFVAGDDVGVVFVCFVLSFVSYFCV